MADAIQRILVIKHGALGDVILASAGFKAIRDAYPNAHITCLTTKTYAPLIKQCPWFNEVLIDSKPKPWNISGTASLIRMLNTPRYDRVFDLQTSSRSSHYWWLLASPTPPFSGVTPFCDMAYTDPARHDRHAHENLVRQLAVAGITNVSLPDISWLEGDITGLALPTPYALVVPGGAAHRPEKRWPAAHFAALCRELSQRGITPVIIGTNAEADVIERLTTNAPESVSLMGKTNFGQLASLARKAAFAVGNDTGPMHIIAATGTPSTVLFSYASSPERSAPVGNHVNTLQRTNLPDLGAHEVLKTLPAQLLGQKIA